MSPDKPMPKVTRGGLVAVLYSPGYGGGWTSWGAPHEMLYDPEVVGLVEADARDQIEARLEARGYKFFMGGADKLEIKWVPEGTLIKITEYDGFEEVEFKEADDWTMV